MLITIYPHEAGTFNIDGGRSTLDIMLLELLKRDGYEVEFVENFTSLFVDQIVSLYKPYSESHRRLSINYTPERMKMCFEQQRFRHGFVIARHRGRIVLTFGVSDYEGWGVITRYLRHNTNMFTPVGYGLSIPFAIDRLHGKIKGLCSVHNFGEKDINAVILSAVKDRCIKNINQPIYKSASMLISTTRKVPYPVVYRNTVQTVYVYGSSLIPPFKPYRQGA